MNLHRLHRLHHRQLVTLQTTNAAVRLRKTRQKGGGNGETIFRFSFKTAKAIAVTCRWFTFGSNPTITQKTQPSQQTDEERATDRHHPTVKTNKTAENAQWTCFHNTVD